MDWEFGVGRYKLLLHLEWINNTVLLYGTGNYIQSPGINHNRKGYLKKDVYIYIYIYIYRHTDTQTHTHTCVCVCKRNTLLYSKNE